MKNWKTLTPGLLGVVILALQTFTSLSAEQLYTLQGAVENIIAAIATLAGLWGVIKSHEKKATVPVETPVQPKQK